MDDRLILYNPRRQPVELHADGQVSVVAAGERIERVRSRQIDRLLAGGALQQVASAPPKQAVSNPAASNPAASIPAASNPVATNPAASAPPGPASSAAVPEPRPHPVSASANDPVIDPAPDTPPAPRRRHAPSRPI